MFKICGVCGKAFEVNEKIKTEKRRKYCSEECAQTEKTNRIRAYRKAHQKPPKNVECVICGKIFLTNRSLKVTCSPECQHKRKAILEKDRAHRQTQIYKEERIAEAAQVRKQKKIEETWEVQAKAEEAGMSYGQYVAMLYMQKERAKNGRC